ncbi:MAG: DUF4389 domain-containing protein [Pseudomonadales bacterium]|nr:DUF4389 domain-containing protein [Pseudomonadales bacterium]
MKNETRENLVNPSIWIRALNMVLFMFAYSFAKAILAFVVLVQFVSVLVTGRANLPLLKFGKNLSVYIYEILDFQTFNTEIRPFPLSPWPEEDHGGYIWLDEPGFHEEEKAEEDIEEVVQTSVEESEGDSESNSEDEPEKK